MRISTTNPTPRRPRKPAPKPSARLRWFSFVVGALTGGVIGYGIAALSPRALLRPGGRFRWDYGRDD
ncbi:MAG TPA: hypothetical protein VGP73_04070 [Thermoanaerobaculia bacterium]